MALQTFALSFVISEPTDDTGVRYGDMNGLASLGAPVAPGAPPLVHSASLGSGGAQQWGHSMDGPVANKYLTHAVRRRQARGCNRPLCHATCRFRAERRLCPAIFLPRPCILFSLRLQHQCQYGVIMQQQCSSSRGYLLRAPTQPQQPGLTCSHAD